jgi:hypothetical protein
MGQKQLIPLLLELLVLMNPQLISLPGLLASQQFFLELCNPLFGCPELHPKLGDGIFALFRLPLDLLLESFDLCQILFLEHFTLPSQLLFLFHPASFLELRHRHLKLFAALIEFPSHLLSLVLDEFELLVKQGCLALVPAIQFVVLGFPRGELAPKLLVFARVQLPLHRITFPHLFDVFHVLLATRGCARLQLFVSLLCQVEFLSQDSLLAFYLNQLFS